MKNGFVCRRTDGRPGLGHAYDRYPWVKDAIGSHAPDPTRISFTR